ncbi:phosphotransferase [Crossiella cryophila]|uniref:Aminoglycoside phosphotransferase (APT) family kinase protein n=1 Tax=Crossiella cryophila TaxID=43355 RepID=A0A7W7CDQ9_9PSEU|nr:phosphotransferase [Crossiella cryophila]MBB4679244.1 aminoglycoside phosphotransferase (APT) family kinase protein [Crossiella cryophila]
MSATVQDAISQVPAWTGRRVELLPMTGGLSHLVAHLRVDGVDQVLRVLDPAVAEAGLGVPLAEEIANTVVAAESGAGPRVLHIIEALPALVLEYLPGRTLGFADTREPGRIPQLAAACRRLHAAPRPFVNDFDIFAKQRRLLEICHRHGLTVFPDYLDHLPIAQELEQVLTADPPPARPCHNDLLAENFLEEPGGIRIVDYQLSGMGDPGFELGNIAAEGQFDPDRLALLANAYSGGADPRLTARTRLFQAMSDFTWTLWFCIHHGLLSKPGSTFDYWGEAAGKWGRAKAALTDPGLGRLLQLAH